MLEVHLTDGRSAVRYDNGNTVLRQIDSKGGEASRMHFTSDEWDQVVFGLVAPETDETPVGASSDNPNPTEEELGKATTLEGTGADTESSESTTEGQAEQSESQPEA